MLLQLDSRRKALVEKISSRLRGGSFLANVLVEEGVTLDRCELLGSVRVGLHSYANDTLLRNVSIGRFVSIGRRCSIGAARHSISGVTTHPIGAPPDFESDPKTIVGNDVWIGDNVLIVAGVKIHDGAVVGGGAVVTKDVDPYTVVAGVPARVIKSRFDPPIVTRLLESMWWQFGVGGIQPASLILSGAVSEDWGPILPPNYKNYFRARGG